MKLCNIKRFGQSTLVLLGIEGQSLVHYAMPVRNYLYDALNYASQIENIQRKHELAHDLKNAELISGFSKEDHIIPVITLCICFDKKAWSGPRSLYDMFDNIPPKILKYVNNYKLNLIAPNEIMDFDKFSSELGTVLNFIQISDNKKAMYDILESGKFKNVSTQTVDMINEYTGTKIPTEKNNGGKIDMGNAWDEIIADKQLEARIEGANELATILKRLKDCATVQTLISEGFNPDIVKEAENLLVSINQ